MKSSQLGTDVLCNCLCFCSQISDIILQIPDPLSALTFLLLAPLTYKPSSLWPCPLYLKTFFLQLAWKSPGGASVPPVVLGDTGRKSESICWLNSPCFLFPVHLAPAQCACCVLSSAQHMLGITVGLLPIPVTLASFKMKNSICEMKIQFDQQNADILIGNSEK